MRRTTLLRGGFAAATVIALSLAGTPSHAATQVVLGATLDTYVASNINTSQASASELKIGATFEQPSGLRRYAYINFDSTTLAGQNVTQARLVLFNTWSATGGCTAAPWRAWRVGGVATAGTVFMSRPPFLQMVGISSATAGGNSCAPQWVSIDVTTLVQQAAASGGVFTIGLSADNDANQFQYKRFASIESGSTPHLVVTY